MTEYFIDADNGNDANDGLSTGAAWLTLDKFTENARSAGDVATLRRGMTNRYDNGSDLLFTSSATIDNPIIIDADYDNDFGDHVDLSATATATLIFGSKTITFASDISGVLAAGDVIYVTAEDAREFAYEVDTVSTTTVTLFLPYKGAEMGSGKAMTNMQSMPKWNTAAGVFQLNFDNDRYWLLRGLYLSGTDSNGIAEIDTAEAHVFIDCVFEGQGNVDYGVKATDDGAQVFLSKCRSLACNGLSVQNGAGWFHFAELHDCLLNGDFGASDAFGGLDLGQGCVVIAVETEFKNHASGDINAAQEGSTVYGRNLVLGSATKVDRHNLATQFQFRAFLEDFDGTVGDTRQLDTLSSAEGTPTIQSETGTVRSGGSNVSIKVTPSTVLGNVQGWTHSRLKLFEHAFYATTDEKTYEVYFRPTATADWTDDPTATELWIEVEYWGHVSNNFRRILKSTGLIDMNGSTAWQSLSVTVAPLQAGVLYLRAYYAKTKEAAKSNGFYCDPLSVVS